MYSSFQRAVKNLVVSMLLFCFLLNNLKGNVCSSSPQILLSIESCEDEYISEGSFGKVYGNSQYVSKTMQNNGSLELELLNNELKIMLAFSQEHDIMGLQNNSCYFKKLNQFDDYEVKIKMFRMKSSLKEAILNEQLRKNTFWKLDVMFQIAASLKKFHDRNIIHLDLKEQNIMMMNEFSPVLADFGFVLFGKEQRNFECGTPLFMAPEIYKKIYSRKTDIFALAIIFFQILNNSFVRTQNFRTYCSYFEFEYEKVYCRLSDMVTQMMNTNFQFRPNIDKILIKIAKEIAYQQYYNNNGYQSYMTAQKNYFDKNSVNFVTQNFRQILKQKLIERNNIYQQAYESQSDQDILNSIFQYTKCQTSPSTVLQKYKQKYDLVGSQVKKENFEQSLQSLRFRIQQADRERNKGLQENNFIQKKDKLQPVVNIVKNQVFPQQPVLKESKREAPLLNGQKKFAKIVFFVKKKEQPEKQNQENQLNVSPFEKKKPQNALLNLEQDHKMQIEQNVTQNQKQQPQAIPNLPIDGQINIPMNTNNIQDINQQIQNNANNQFATQQLQQKFDKIHSKLAIPNNDILNIFLEDLKKVKVQQDLFMDIDQENGIADGMITI